MKSKILIIICLLGLQVMWGQEEPVKEEPKKETKGEKKKREEAEKAAKLKEAAGYLAGVYKAELQALNTNIAEMNKLLSDENQGEAASSRILASIEELIKKRNDLNAKITKLETNPQESDVEADAVKNKIDVKEARYTFLNGVNFDFNESKTNYVGHFNIYVPSYEDGSTINHWGVNVGILKVNYMTRDSIVNYSTDNVRINPLDTPDTPGESYNRQYNRYTTSSSVTSTSFYAQPLLRIHKQGAAVFYAHAHAELLWSKFETGTKVKTIQNEQVTISAENPAPAPESLRIFEGETRQTVNVVSPHFGLGFTVDFNFKDDCILFLQPTMGLALNNINRYPTQDPDGNYTLNKYTETQGFFLVRCFFQYNTSKATQIIIGTDIRGLLPDQQAYISAYVGLNVGIDQIFKQ